MVGIFKRTPPSIETVTYLMPQNHFSLTAFLCCDVYCPFLKGNEKVQVMYKQREKTCLTKMVKNGVYFIVIALWLPSYPRFMQTK